MALTVTASIGGASSDGIILTVAVLTGARARASQTGGATSAGEIAGHSPDPPITPTQTGSWIYAAAGWAPATAIGSPVTGTTIDQSYADVIAGAVWHATDTTDGTQVFPGSSSPITTAGEYALAEILASSTIAKDASSPSPADSSAGVSVTTASFSPPSGSLLVACAAGYGGGAGIDTPAIADTASLTWTQLVIRATDGQGFAVVWVADAPSSGTSVAGVVSPLALTAPAGSVTAGGDITGAAAPLTLTAPPGAVSAGAAVTGAPAPLALGAPAGAVTAGAAVTGAVAPVALAAPAGTIQAGAVVAGVVATAALAAPAGTASAGAVTAGAVARVTLAAPAGTAAGGGAGSVAGVPAALALAAPPGTVSAGATVAGAVARLALAAPGGAIVTGSAVAGATAALALAAPAGSVRAGAVVQGATAVLVLAAPAGSASGPPKASPGAFLVFFP